jgi:hypothetical protein
LNASPIQLHLSATQILMAHLLPFCERGESEKKYLLSLRRRNRYEHSFEDHLSQYAAI